MAPRKAKKRTQGSAAKSKAKPTPKAGILPPELEERAQGIANMLAEIGDPGARIEELTNPGIALINREPSMLTAELCLRWFDEIKWRALEGVRRDMALKTGRMCMHVDGFAGGGPSWPDLHSADDPYKAWQQRVTSAGRFSEMDYVRIIRHALSQIMAGEEKKASS